MKKLIALLILTFTILSCGLAFAEEEYPRENYEMYYQGNKVYPIAIAQMGYGFMVDWYSIRPVGYDPNELIADVHQVIMDRDIVRANPWHVYVKYNADKSFKIGIRDNPQALVPAKLFCFDESFLNKGTSETGVFFPLGRTIYESYKRDQNYKPKPLYPAWPMLKPVGESGAPTMIKVNDNTMYFRTGLNTASVMMLKPTGNESYDITFYSDYFIISRIHATNEEIKARLIREELNRKMYYKDNPRVQLVANYMGVIWKLSEVELEQVNAIGEPRG